MQILSTDILSTEYFFPVKCHREKFQTKTHNIFCQKTYLHIFVASLTEKQYKKRQRFFLSNRETETDSVKTLIENIVKIGTEIFYGEHHT